MTSPPVPPRLWRTPRRVDVALTGACNLTCAYCSYGARSGARHPEDMTRARLLALMDEMGECGVMHVCLTGGEPLLRSDLGEIVAAVVRNRMRFSVATNGILLTEALARELAGTRRLDLIQVSIDGAASWANDRGRDGGALEGALRGLRILAVLGVPRAVRLTLTRFTAPGLEETLEALLPLTPVVGTSELMPFGRGRQAYDTLAMTGEERMRVAGVLARYAERHPGRIQASAGPLALSRDMAVLQEGAPGPGGGFLSSCRGFHDALAVLHDGWIVPCIQTPDLRLGRVGEVGIAETWMTHETLRELRGRFTVPLTSLASCRGCRYIPFCRGGCPANALAAFGTHLAPDPIHCLRRLIDGIEPGGGSLLHGRDGRAHVRPA